MFQISNTAEWHKEYSAVGACRQDMNDGMTLSSIDNKLDEFLDAMIAKHGNRRVTLILASTVRVSSSNDPRYVQSVRDWAARQPYFPAAPYNDDQRQRSNHDFFISTHACIVNSVAEKVIQKEAERTRASIKKSKEAVR